MSTKKFLIILIIVVVVVAIIMKRNWSRVRETAAEDTPEQETD